MTPTNSSKASPIFDMVFSVFLIMSVFFIFTNGIPFIQMHLLPATVKKGFFMSIMRASIVCIFLVTTLIRLKYRSFAKLSAVILFNKFIGQPTVRLCSLFFASYAAIFISYGFFKHSVLQTRAFDLGIFAQSIWNTLHGQFLFSSIKGNICLLGDHVSPLLALLTPFYAIWPDPRMLLIIQAIFAAACFFPLGVLCDIKLRDNYLKFSILACFFFFLPARAALREDFHPEVLVDVFIFFAFICSEKRKLTLFVLLLLLIATAKENMLGVTFIFGVYAIIKKQKLLGLSIMALSAVVFIAELKWLVPFLSGKPYFYQDNYLHLFRHVSSGGVLLDRLEYLLKLFGPFLFLPFFYLPTLLLTVPVLFQNLLSQNPLMLSFSFHYLSGLTPFVFIGTIYGFARLMEKFPSVAANRRWAASLMLMIVMLRGAPSEYFFIWRTAYDTSAHTEIIRKKLAQIPGNYSVLTHNSFVPQLSNRMYVYQFDLSDNVKKADLALKLKADYVIFDRDFWEGAAVETVLPALYQNGYVLNYEKDGFYILTKDNMKVNTYA